MYHPFGEAQLKTGEMAEIGVVLGPDPGDPHQVAGLLAHKGEHWRWHIESALAESLDGLETRWYLAGLDGRTVSNVMTVEHAGVGILGHVFTVPEQRRKGLCAAIFDRLMPDFRDRGGLRMTLGTGYNSPPYWIYHRYGFRSIVPETGFMKYEAVDGFAERWYAPGEATVEPLSWRHGPPLAQLFADDVGDGLQVLMLGGFGPFNFEGAALSLLHTMRQRADTHGVALRTPAGAAVGFALLQPDPRWQRRVYILDLVAHPNFHERLGDLLAGLPPVEAKVQAFVPSAAQARRAALEAAGFAQEGLWRGQLPDGGDLIVYARDRR